VIADGTHWASGATAIGTIAVAIVALGIAIYSERRTDKRVKAEREHGDGVLAEERRLADKRLADQMAHSDAQLAEERAAADRRLERERQIAQERVQLAEAYAVEVTAARMSAEAYGSQITTTPDEPIACAVAIVVNGGHYTITRLQAQFCTGSGSLTSYGRTEYFSSMWRIEDSPLSDGVMVPEREIRLGTLTPSDLGMRYSHDAQVIRHLVGSYPIVRWRDQWGISWEHKLGEVRQIQESEPWKA